MMKATYPAHENYKPSGYDWVGDVPAHWAVEKLGTSLRAVSEKNRPDLPLLSITREKGVIERDLDDEESNHNFIPDDLSGYKVLRAGQFGMNKMKAWQGSYGVSEHTGIVSPAYFIFDFTKEIDPSFFNRAIRSKLYVSFFGSASDGVRIGQWDLNKARMREIPLLVPPLPEQHAIAAFLDDKCAKIEGAVKIKEDQIALLRERRQIIIQDAVTRGLNPAAPMKDSGIDWIGQIPAHWENMPNKYLFRLKKDTVGTRSAEYDLLSLTLRGIIKRDMENPEGKFPAEFDTYQEVCPGDFVFCHFDVEETPRTVGLSEFFGMITGAYTVYSVAQGVDPRFLLHFYIFADTDKKMRSMYKGLRNTIPKDAFAAFKTPLPPIEEQRAIVAHIDDASQKIEDGIAIKERQIAALKEYKTSLINAAVTGKIKVI
ncbi:restriction endonuclease subunit S [Paracoccaceae bacterium]